jgi:hypothetical protein
MSNTILDHILNDPENDIDLQVGLDALPLFTPGLCLTLNPDPIMSSSAILALVVDENTKGQCSLLRSGGLAHELRRASFGRL